MITKRNNKGQIVKIERTAEWLFSKVTPVTESGCWIWNGHIGKHGYGTYTIGAHPNSRGVTTHRLSWEIHNGAIPEGLFILHKCDVRACVNPEHLFLGTHRDNMDDAKQKGRMTGNPSGVAWNKNKKGYRLKSKLSSEAKDEILSLINEGAMTMKDISKLFNITEQAVYYYRRLAK